MNIELKIAYELNQSEINLGVFLFDLPLALSFEIPTSMWKNVSR